MNDHYKKIKTMIDQRGIDSTDDILKEKLSFITKKVISLREQIDKFKNVLDATLNRDELNHLQYDIQDTEEQLSNSLKELKEADELYAIFNDYIKKIR